MAPSKASTRVTTPDVPAAGRGVWLRLVGFVLVLAVGGALALLVTGDTGSLREQVTGAGAVGWGLFVAAYVAATLLLLPKNVLSVVAGLTYGAALGTVLVWVAAVLGASAAFWIARALGRDGVARLVGPAMARLDEWVARRGALAVLVARLVPVLPFTAVNYASGLTVVGFVPYLLATAVGILPGTVAYVVIGAYGSDPGSWPFVAALAGLVLLGCGGLVWRHRERRHRA